jgi:hypothetical protein
MLLATVSILVHLLKTRTHVAQSIGASAASWSCSDRDRGRDVIQVSGVGVSGNRNESTLLLFIITYVFFCWSSSESGPLRFFLVLTPVLPPWSV